MKFDVVFLDGDHNYHTVSSEMQHMNSLIHDNSIVVVDDYSGRWGERDMWYAEREGYESVSIASTKIDTEKHGVKPAIDEWLEKNPGWNKQVLMGGEPVVLTKNFKF